jgi:hypothetical protein
MIASGQNGAPGSNARVFKAPISEVTVFVELGFITFKKAKKIGFNYL